MDSITSSQVLSMLQDLASNTTANMGVLVCSIVFGALLCFCGIKVIKILSALIGFAIGMGIGIVIGKIADISGFTYIILIFGCAILIGVLSFFIYRISVFIFTFFVFFLTVIVVIGSYSKMACIAGAAVGLILAIISMIFMEPMIMVVTAIWGGLCCGDGIAQLAHLANAETMSFAIGGGLAIVGMLLQFICFRKRPRKAKKAKKTDNQPEIVENQPASVEEDVEEDEEYYEDDEY